MEKHIVPARLNAPLFLPPHYQSLCTLELEVFAQTGAESIDKDRIRPRREIDLHTQVLAASAFHELTNAPANSNKGELCAPHLEERFQRATDLALASPLVSHLLKVVALASSWQVIFKFHRIALGIYFDIDL